jgi:TQXA domain-containing protein/LPXTG-motif cell wall-anchored protein
MKGKVSRLQRFKKTTSLVLTFLLLLSTLLVTVNAAEPTYRYTGVVDVGYHNTAIIAVMEWNGSSLIGGVYSTYCIDNTIEISAFVNYHLTALTDGNIRAIMLSSYPNVSLSTLKTAAGITNPITTAQAITGTQFAIWKLTNGSDPDAGFLDADETLIYNYLLGLSPAPANPLAVSTAAFSLISKTIKANGDAEIVISYPKNATSTNSNGSSIPLTLSYGVDLNTTYPGSTIVKTSDGTINTETITIPAAVFLSDISFSVKLSGTQTIFDAYRFDKVDLKDDEQQPLVGFMNKSFDVSALETVNVEKADGVIVISKMIQDRPNDQTSFQVNITGPGEYTKTVSVSQGAPVTVDKLAYGTYTVTEVPAAGYHAVSTNPITVTLSGETARKEVSFVNAYDPILVYGAITVIKDVTNVDNDPTEFEVKINDLYVLKVKEGVPQTIYVPLGAYSVTETAIDGYNNISITPSSFILTTKGQVVNVVNEKDIVPPTGSITVIKEFENDITDSTTFTVDITGPEGYSNSISISQGNPVIISGLALGEYTLVEAGKDGYITISDATVSTSLTADVLDASVTFVNGPEEIIIPPDEPPGDLPQTGGLSSSGFYGLGILLTLTGMLFMFIHSKKEELYF